MTRSILLFLILLLGLSPVVISQKLKRAEKEIVDELQSDVSYLSSDKLEGRRSGKSGETMASDYIVSSYSKIGLKPLGDSGTFLQRFEIYDGKDISHTRFAINNTPLTLTTEFFPMSFSASAHVEGSPAIALQESGLPWFYDLKEILENAQTNPHFDLGKMLREKTKLFEGKGATAVIFYNSSKIDDGLVFDPAEGIVTEKIPVIYVTQAGRKKFLRDEGTSTARRQKVTLLCIQTGATVQDVRPESLTDLGTLLRVVVDCTRNRTRRTIKGTLLGLECDHTLCTLDVRFQSSDVGRHLVKLSPTFGGPRLRCKGSHVGEELIAIEFQLFNSVQTMYCLLPIKGCETRLGTRRSMQSDSHFAVAAIAL